MGITSSSEVKRGVLSGQCQGGGVSTPGLGSARMGKQDKYLSVGATPPDLYSSRRQAGGDTNKGLTGNYSN